MFESAMTELEALLDAGSQWLWGQFEKDMAMMDAIAERTQSFFDRFFPPR